MSSSIVINVTYFQRITFQQRSKSLEVINYFDAIAFHSNRNIKLQLFLKEYFLSSLWKLWKLL